MDGKDRILSLVSSESVLDSIDQLLCDEENATVISSISDMEMYQPYCMILTIKDTKHTAPVYDEVTQQLTERNFVHYDVRVRNNIQVINSVG